MRTSAMNALDLRADHPKLLRDYTADTKRPVAHRLAGALRRLVVPSTRLKPAAVQ